MSFIFAVSYSLSVVRDTSRVNLLRLCRLALFHVLGELTGNDQESGIRSIPGDYPSIGTGKMSFNLSQHRADEHLRIMYEGSLEQSRHCAQRTQCRAGMLSSCTSLLID
jgi:hypothetical protein